MCGRYSLVHSTGEILDRFGLPQLVIDGIQLDIEPEPQISPGRLIGAVTQEHENCPRLLQAFKWGFIPNWVKDNRKFPPVINARAESLLEKAYFRGALRSRRCLIPADGFFEWLKEPTCEAGGTSSGRRPYRFAFKDQRLFAFAGLFEEWASPTGGEIVTCCIITVNANSLVAPFHDRMPAILAPEDETHWLNSQVQPHEALYCLNVYDPYEMTATPVELLKAKPGSKKNRASSDIEQLRLPGF
jgi:putative SOS response-associated peptidase YedK